MRYDQRPAFEAVGWVWPIEKPHVPCSPIRSCPDNTLLLATLHFSPHAQFCGSANITLHLVHIPHFYFLKKWGEKKAERRVDINLGQLSAQFLPLSELFVSAAESFIIMGSWCAKGKAWLLSDRTVNVNRWSWENESLDFSPLSQIIFISCIKLSQFYRPNSVLSIFECRTPNKYSDLW